MNSLTITTVPFKSTGLSNYFRSSDVAPSVDGDTLTIIDGYGERRYWGTPSVKSHVIQLTDDVVQVSVTGWHKHTVSPVGGTYYFVRETGGWVRRTAAHKRVKAARAN